MDWVRGLQAWKCVGLAALLSTTACVGSPQTSSDASGGGGRDGGAGHGGRGEVLFDGGAGTTGSDGQAPPDGPGDGVAGSLGGGGRSGGAGAAGAGGASGSTGPDGSAATGGARATGGAGGTAAGGTSGAGTSDSGADAAADAPPARDGGSDAPANTDTPDAPSDTGAAIDGATCVEPAGEGLSCAACDDRVCDVAQTLFTCGGGGDECDHPICAGNFANCDRRSPDCESAIGTMPGCFPTYLGTYAIPTLYNEAATAIAADGSTYFGASFRQTTDFDPGAGADVRVPRGSSDAFIVKLTPDGSYAWAITMGDPSSITVLRSMRVSPTSVVVAGLFMGDVDFDPGPGVAIRGAGSSQFATFVASFTFDGKLEWVSPLVATGGSQPMGLAIAPDGSVYVGGQYSGNGDFDPGPGTDLGAAGPAFQGFLVKLSGDDGRWLWSRKYEGGSGAIDAVTISADGNVWVTGETGGTTFGGVPLNPTADFATMVASFTPAGTPRFASVFEGASSQGWAVAGGTDGSIYVGGGGNGIVDFDLGPGTTTRRLLGSGASGYVVKLGPDGALRWVRTFPSMQVFSLAPGRDGGVLALATPRVPGASGGSAGYLVTKLEADGVSAWSMRGGVAGVAGQNLAAGASTFALAGGAESQSDYDPGPGTDIKSSDITFVSRFRE